MRRRKNVHMDGGIEHFVEKVFNSPKVPQARPIENLRGILAQKFYEGEWQAIHSD